MKIKNYRIRYQTGAASCIYTTLAAIKKEYQYRAKMARTNGDMQALWIECNGERLDLNYSLLDKKCILSY